MSKPDRLLNEIVILDLDGQIIYCYDKADSYKAEGQDQDSSIYYQIGASLVDLKRKSEQLKACHIGLNITLERIRKISLGIDKEGEDSFTTEDTEGEE